MRKLLITAFIVIGITVITYAFFNRNRNENDVLIVGTAAGYAPWVSINEYGNYEGFDIDVMQEVAKKLHKKLVIKDLGSMTSLFMALEQDSIDAIIWGMSITQDRLQKIAMVRYQGDTTSSYPLLFWQQIPNQIHSIHDMKGMTVAVEPSSSQEKVLQKYEFITPLSMDKVDDALLSIQYAKADAALVEPAIAKKFKNKYPNIQILDIPLDPQDQVHGVGICIKKDNISLINEIEKAVQELKQEGVISALESKWEIAS